MTVDKSLLAGSTTMLVLKLLDGQDITALPPERRPVSTVFQSYGLFPHMSVLQNVTYGLKFRGYSRAEAKEKGRRYLSLVGLAERENAAAARGTRPRAHRRAKALPA